MVDSLLWIVAWALAAAFAVAGMVKLVTPYARLRAGGPSTAWVGDFSPVQVKAIGLVELAGAAGLVLPPLVGIAEGLVALAAAGLALDMLGAFSTHLRRNDPRRSQLVNVVLGSLATILALGRFWFAPF